MNESTKLCTIFGTHKQTNRKQQVELC